MAASIEMGQSDQVRQIGVKLCGYANGSCLCKDKGRVLCPNVRGLALECWEIAHQKTMTRENHNDVTRVAKGLDASAVGRAAPRSPGPAKKVRR